MIVRAAAAASDANAGSGIMNHGPDSDRSWIGACGARMTIDKGASVAVVVNRAWANLHGVKLFLRQGEGPQTDIRGVDESHILFAKVLDAEDPRGVWIEVHTDRRSENPPVHSVKMLVPWSQVLTIVVAQQFSPAIRKEARRIGFTGEVDWEPDE